MPAWRTLASIFLALALPAAAQDRASPDVPLPPPPSSTAPSWAGGVGWRVAPVLGVGAWRDGAAADTQPAVIGGLEGEWRGYRHHAVLADFRYGAYRRHVLTAPPDGVAVRESDLGLRLAYAYEFLHHWTSSGRATGELLVGGFWRTIQDQAAARLRVGYRSEILILEHGDRSFDGLALVLDLGL